MRRILHNAAYVHYGGEGGRVIGGVYCAEN